MNKKLFICLIPHQGEPRVFVLREGIRGAFDDAPKPTYWQDKEAFINAFGKEPEELAKWPAGTSFWEWTDWRGWQISSKEPDDRELAAEYYHNNHAVFVTDDPDELEHQVQKYARKGGHQGSEAVQCVKGFYPILVDCYISFTSRLQDY